MNMKWKAEDLAASVSRNEGIVDMLDALLTEPDDRAYVVCYAYDCLNNSKGRCNIHTVKGKRRILSNGRCAEHESQ